MEVIHLTKEEFLKRVNNYEANSGEWKYEGDRPCIVDFYATWCGPCKALAPSLEELAEEYSDKIYVYKVDVDKEQKLSAAFGINTIPTLLWSSMNEKPSFTQGLVSTNELRQLIDDKLLNLRDLH